MNRRSQFYIGVVSAFLTITALTFTVGKPHYMRHHGYKHCHNNTENTDHVCKQNGV